MNVYEYLSVLRRRWLYLAVGLLAGAVAGFLTAPGPTDAPARFQGTHTLLVDANSTTGANLNLEQSALLASAGPVPMRVEQRLADEGLPSPSDVTAEADLDVRSLAITATSSTMEGAARAADLTAEEITAELVGADRSVYDEELGSLGDQIAEAEADLDAISFEDFVLPPEDLARLSLEDQRSTVESLLINLRSQVQTLEADGPPTPPLSTLEVATGGPATPEGWKLPESPASRSVILGGIGLILGLVGALLADRLDTRVRGKDDAERAFDLPVIAEIPELGGGRKERALLVVTKPASPFVESYRALRTVVLFSATEAAGQRPPDAAASNGTPRHRAQVVLVTSPSAGEGKSTTAAHLAAVLAEADHHTLVISADFRRPRIHEYFGVAREPGLADVLASGPSRVRLSDLQMATTFEGVHLLPSGSPVNNPAQLLNETSHLIGAARQLFDYIIIDTPPLLVANDATELAAEADMVILVAKADRTSREAARRATEVLRRVDAPLLGVVVTAAHDTPTAYGYYRHRYYADTDQGGRRRGRESDAKPSTPNLERVPLDKA
ncbi:MAG: CpsD/CapB family tyrosine-protein kinase [Acidimicrobiales bacterium]